MCFHTTAHLFRCDCRLSKHGCHIFKARPLDSGWVLCKRQFSVCLLQSRNILSRRERWQSVKSCVSHGSSSSLCAHPVFFLFHAGMTMASLVPLQKLHYSEHGVNMSRDHEHQGKLQQPYQHCGLVSLPLLFIFMAHQAHKGVQRMGRGVCQGGFVEGSAEGVLGCSRGATTGLIGGCRTCGDHQARFS